MKSRKDIFYKSYTTKHHIEKYWMSKNSIIFSNNFFQKMNINYVYCHTPPLTHHLITQAFYYNKTHVKTLSTNICQQTSNFKTIPSENIPSSFHFQTTFEKYQPAFSPRYLSLKTTTKHATPYNHTTAFPPPLKPQHQWLNFFVCTCLSMRACPGPSSPQNHKRSTQYTCTISFFTYKTTTAHSLCVQTLYILLPNQSTKQQQYTL